MALPARTTDVIFNSGETSETTFNITIDRVADDGDGYDYFTSDLIVEVDGVTLEGYTIVDMGSSINIVLDEAIVPSVTPLRIRRSTETEETLVVHPVTHKLDAQRHLNKQAHQWLFLVNELLDLVYTCVKAVVVTGRSMIGMDFLGYNGVNCRDPEEDQDVATKKYVNDEDDRILAEAKAYTDEQIDALRDELTTYIDAQDAATLASANSYTDAAIASLRSYILTLIGSTFIPGTTTILEESHTLSSGETEITSTYALDDGYLLVTVDGAVQRLTDDYTVTDSNTLTLVDSYTTDTTVHIIHFKIEE